MQRWMEGKEEKRIKVERKDNVEEDGGLGEVEEVEG